MDVRRWGLNQIMQLPDCCFGRRYLVSCSLNVLSAQRVWDISEVALPDRCVIWELMIRGTTSPENIVDLRIALGDQLPTAVAMFNRLEPMFMGLGRQAAEPRPMVVAGGDLMHWDRLRLPVAAQGRRLVIEALTGELVVGNVLVGIVVSGLPTEVPDWLCSGNLRSP